MPKAKQTLSRSSKQDMSHPIHNHTHRPPSIPCPSPSLDIKQTSQKTRLPSSHHKAPSHSFNSYIHSFNHSIIHPTHPSAKSHPPQQPSQPSIQSFNQAKKTTYTATQHASDPPDDTYNISSSDLDIDIYKSGLDTTSHPSIHPFI